jgi:protein gp37
MFSFLSHNHKKTGDTCNPLAGGCLHKCPYCYVETLKKLFPGCRIKYSGATRIDAKELKQISKFTAADFVFLCDCTDLFGHWVPTELIVQIFEAVKASPARFLLLTKNPQRYRYLISIGIPIPANCVLGCTVESDISHMLCGQPNLSRLDDMADLSKMGYPVMLSIEPVMKFNSVAFPLLIASVHPQFVAVGYDSGHNKLPEPRLAETLELIACLEAAGITVHRKYLRKGWNEDEMC